jgi:diguanylate cyclase (GGDEF)-like protein
LKYGPEAVSVYDYLTGFLNRRVFYELAKGELRRAFIQNNSFIVIMVDIDNLKEVNDSLGHHKGDELIKKTADFLSKNCRGTDLFCRHGGDEFLICLTRIREKDKYKVRQKLEKKLNNQEELSLSFGISVWDKSKSLKKIIKEADAKMYAHKNSKKIKRNEFLRVIDEGVLSINPKKT